MEAIAVSTNNLTKVYNQGKANEVVALNNLNLSVRKGEIYGLLGGNGAGKTTTVRILTTMIRATSGSATIHGMYDIIRNSREVRAIVGCLPQDAGLYEEFDAVENLDFIAQLRGLDDVKRKNQIEELIQLVGLENRKNDRVETYSGGMKRRLMIARSMMGNPEILFLDEPTAGIDVLVSRKIRELIKQLSTNKNITTVVSTHDMIFAERLCDRVGIIRKGKLVAEDTPSAIIEKYGDGGDLEDAVVHLIGWTGDEDEEEELA